MAVLMIGCAYHAPDAPSPTTPISTTVPFSLTLGATVGMGADAGRATVTAKVQNVNGAVLPGVTVHFTTDIGTLSADSVVTGGDGTAATTLTAAGTAALTATAGTLTRNTLVVSQPVVIPPSAPPPSVPTPGSPNPGPLSVTLSAGDVIFGAQTIVSADVKNGPPQSLAWSFSDGTTFAGTSTTTAHTFGAVGRYTIGVTVVDTIGRRASATTTTTVNAAPPAPGPAPPPGPSYTVTLAASPTTVFTGGSSTLTATVALANGATAPTTYSWDCNGDGTVDATTTTSALTSSTTCSYPTNGTITSNVTVTNGTATGSGTTTVTVTTPPPPTATINCSTGARVTVGTGSASNCVASGTVNGASVSGIGPVVWDFGDGTAPVTSTGNTSPPHQYLTANTFTVIAQVKLPGVAAPISATTTTTVAP